MDDSTSICGWKVLEEAGVGRVGRTFVVCRDAEPARQFVLKLWRDDQPGLARDVNVKEAERLREAEVPGRMPRLVEVGEWNGAPFFVMEKIEGIDYPIPMKEYRTFYVETFAALGELHRAGLLHGDLTPSHLGRKNGFIAFIDFDSALTFDEAAKNKDCIGTDPYIAPEVASQGKVSVQSDLFALATILTERCPKKLRDCFEPVSRECLRPDPDERPRSAAEFAERLRTCRAPHHRFKAVVRWLFFAAAVILLGAIALALTSRLHRRAQITGEELAISHAEAEALAGKRYFYERQHYGLAVRHLEKSLRTPGFVDREVYQLLSRCYGEGLGVDMDLKKSHDYDQLSKRTRPTTRTGE